MLRIKKINIGMICIVIGMFFLSGHSLIIVSPTIVKILFIFLTILGCIKLQPKLKIEKKINDKILFIILIFSGMSLSQLLYFKYNAIVEVFMLMGRILAAYYICNCIEAKKFYKMFATLMGILTIIALIVHFLVEFNITVPNYTYISRNGFIYHTIGLCTWDDLSNELSGPFWEAGLYCSMALFAIVSEFCLNETKARKWIMITLICGIIVSRSTAGYLLLALTIYIVIFGKRKHNLVIEIVTVIIILFFYLYWSQIVQILYNWKPDVFWKLVEKSVTINTRLYSPLVCISIFFKSPVVGFGQTYALEQYIALKSLYGIDSLTSTTTFMLAAFGIFGISYTYLLIRGVFKQKQYSLSIRIMLFILIFVIVNKEPHTSIIITYIILFYLNTRGAITYE